jgi:hypothetical protein
MFAAVNESGIADVGSSLITGKLPSVAKGRPKGKAGSEIVRPAERKGSGACSASATVATASNIIIRACLRR